MTKITVTVGKSSLDVHEVGTIITLLQWFRTNTNHKFNITINGVIDA